MSGFDTGVDTLLDEVLGSILSDVVTISRSNELDGMRSRFACGFAMAQMQVGAEKAESHAAHRDTPRYHPATGPPSHQPDRRARPHQTPHHRRRHHHHHRRRHHHAFTSA